MDTAAGEPEGWAGWRAAVALPLSVDPGGVWGLLEHHCLHAAFTWWLPPTTDQTRVTDSEGVRRKSGSRTKKSQP